MNRNYFAKIYVLSLLSLFFLITQLHSQDHTHIGKLFEDFYGNEFYNKFLKLYGVPPKFSFTENDTVNDILVYSIPGIDGYEIMTRYKLEGGNSLIGFITMNCAQTCIISKIVFYNTDTTPWKDVTTDVFPEEKVRMEFQKKLRSVEKGKKKNDTTERIFWIRLASKEKDIITGVVENQFKENENFYTSGILVFDGKKFIFSDPNKPKPKVKK